MVPSWSSSINCIHRYHASGWSFLDIYCVLLWTFPVVFAICLWFVCSPDLKIIPYLTTAICTCPIIDKTYGFISPPHLQCYTLQSFPHCTLIFSSHLLSAPSVCSIACFVFFIRMFIIQLFVSWSICSMLPSGIPPLPICPLKYGTLIPRCLSGWRCHLKCSWKSEKYTLTFEAAQLLSGFVSK